MATSEPQAPSLKPGTRLLGYSVLGLLAQGGMAEVYLARRAGSSPVVIKRIRPNLVEDPQFVRMFVDEARLAQMLHHANVVKVLEVGQDNGVYALAMEFLDGRNLLRVARACYQRRAYVPYELMGRIVADSLSGLEHAHTQKGPDGQPLNMVHRDMSPENIVVTYDGRVKVVDFGIAKAANMEGRTQVGVIKGKLGYVAPEAISGDKLDGRADIFAMGVTLYELLTYTVPFAGSNEVEVLTAISTREPAAPRTLNPSVPQPLEDICMRALEKNRQKRWQSAAEMRGALEAFVRSTGKGTSNQHLGVFMDALFPKGTDKDRVRVAELLSLPEPDAEAPAFGKAGSRPGAAAANKGGKEAGGKPSGPAWSKALQIEAMMDGGSASPPKSAPSTAGKAAPAPAPRKPHKSNELKTDTMELSDEELSDLRVPAPTEHEVNTADVEVFDEPSDDGATTRVEDRGALEAALRAAMGQATETDQATQVVAPPKAPKFDEPAVTAPTNASPVPPRKEARTESQPRSPAVSSPGQPKKRPPPTLVEAPLIVPPPPAPTATPAAPRQAIRAVIPPPTFNDPPPKAPYEISGPELQPVPEVELPVPEPAVYTTAPSARPVARAPEPEEPEEQDDQEPEQRSLPTALMTQESDVLVPPVLPRRRMNPVLAMVLGMMLATIITVGAVAAAAVAGVAHVQLPQELGGFAFPEAPGSPAPAPQDTAP